MSGSSSGTVSLDFGSDTLCLIRFIDRIYRKEADIERIFAELRGRINEHDDPENFDETISGRICGYTLDGYLRSLKIRADDGKEWSSGGSNATAEDFASVNLSIDIPREYFTRYHEPYLPFYEPVLIDDGGIGGRGVSEQALQNAIETQTFDVAMALARRIPIETSFNYLISCLQEVHSKNRMEFVCEGFRSLEELYKSSELISRKGFRELRQFIEDNESSNRGYDVAIVYAAEPLGYIARSTETNVSESIATYLFGLLRSTNGESHPHLFWSVVCSISHTELFKDLNRLHELKEILEKERSNESKYTNQGKGRLHLDVPEKIIDEAIKRNSGRNI